MRRVYIGRSVLASLAALVLSAATLGGRDFHYIDGAKYHEVFWADLSAADARLMAEMATVT